MAVKGFCSDLAPSSCGQDTQRELPWPCGHRPWVPLKAVNDSPILIARYFPTHTSFEEEALSSGTQNRRSGRVTLCVPLRICEPGTSKRFGVGEAVSVKVSLWGGLLAFPLESVVSHNQKLLLVNQHSAETKESEVVYLGIANSNRRLVAVEFLEPSPSFWGLTFPPIAPRRSTSRTVEPRRSAYS